MKTSYILLIAGFSLLATSSYAQESKIKIIQSPKLTLIENQHLLQQDVKDDKVEEVQATRGYRIQIYSGNSRSEAENIRLNYMGVNPGVQCYIEFISPYYKVRIGNYLTDAEANKDLRKIKQSYPMAFIVSSYIDS